MRGLLNIVDLIAIFPFYLELFMNLCGFDVDSLSDIKGKLKVIYFSGTGHLCNVNFCSVVSILKVITLY
jgi:hypothetical protein